MYERFVKKMAKLLEHTSAEQTNAALNYARLVDSGVETATNMSVAMCNRLDYMLKMHKLNNADSVLWTAFVYKLSIPEEKEEE